MGLLSAAPAAKPDYSGPTLIFTAIGAAAACAGVVTAVVIAFIVSRSSKRSARSAAMVQAELRNISIRSRRDELARLLAEVQDSQHLRVLVDEARVTVEGPELLPLLKAYYCNPAVPLPTHNLPPAPVVEAIIDALDLRLRDKSIQVLLRELAPFAAAAKAPGDQRWRIVSYVMNRVRINDGRDLVAHRYINEFLEHGNVDLATIFLHDIDGVHGLKVGDRANVLYGSCAAIQAAYIRRTSAFPTSSVGGRPQEDLGLDVVRALATLLHRDQLAGIGGWDEEDMTTTPLECACVVTFLCGRLSGLDDHLDVRTLQNLPTMLNSLPLKYLSQGSLPLNELADGLAEFERRRPEPEWDQLRHDLQVSVGRLLNAARGDM